MSSTPDNPPPSLDRHELLRELEAEDAEVARENDRRFRASQPLAWLVQQSYSCLRLPDGSGEILRGRDLVITVPRDCVRWLADPPPLNSDPTDAAVPVKMKPDRARLLKELRDCERERLEQE